MVDQNRQLQVFRGAVKEQLREKGIKLSRNFGRDLSNEVKTMNDRLHLDVPITDKEVAEIYLELARELFAEHCELVISKFFGGKDPAKVVPQGA